MVLGHRFSQSSYRLIERPVTVLVESQDLSHLIASDERIVMRQKLFERLFCAWRDNTAQAVLTHK